MKRFLSVLLILVLLAGLALPVGARQSRSRIAYIDRNAYSERLGNAAIHPEKTQPGDEIIIPLLADGFRDANGAVITDFDPSRPGYGPSVSQLKSNRVVPHLRVIKGSEYIRDISLIEYPGNRRIKSQAAIRIRFVKDVPSTKEITYRLYFYLTLDGRKMETDMWLDGMMRNERVDIYGHDYVFIGDGLIAAASATSMDVQLDLGNGVSIYRDMFPGDLFYGRAEISGNDGQDKILRAAPEIHTVYDLTTIDVKFNGPVVTLEHEVDNPNPKYVYNLAGQFVGMSNQRLPYSTRYYLSNVELEIDPSLAELPERTLDERTMGAGLRQFLNGLEENNAKMFE